MKRILIDSCVLISLLNIKDSNHEKARSFFDEITALNKNGKTTTVVLPAHALVEVNVTIQRLKRQNELEGYASFLAKGGPEECAIDRGFIEKVQGKKLYRDFSVLKSADAIYGMIAYLENIPLYTFDKDFEKIQHLVEVHVL